MKGLIKGKLECWYTEKYNTGDYRQDTIGVFPKWNRNSVNSRNLVNHWSMNLSQFKDSVFSNVSCWHSDSILVSNTTGSKFEPFYCSDKYFCHWIQRIPWKHLGKLNCSILQLVWQRWYNVYVFKSHLHLTKGKKLVPMICRKTLRHYLEQQSISPDILNLTPKWANVIWYVCHV